MVVGNKEAVRGAESVVSGAVEPKEQQISAGTFSEFGHLHPATPTNQPLNALIKS